MNKIQQNKHTQSALKKVKQVMGGERGKERKNTQKGQAINKQTNKRENKRENKEEEKREKREREANCILVFWHFTHFNEMTSTSELRQTK